MLCRKKQSAIEEYHKAMDKYNTERERIIELQKRDKDIDVETLILSKAKKYNLAELRERALEERRSYLKAEKDFMQIRNREI